MSGDSRVKHFSIVLDREDETFKPGELLSGKVLVEFSQPKKVRGLRIEVFGESVVGWSVSIENPAEKGKMHDVMITSREENLSVRYYVLGNETGRPIELPVAQLAYPFSVQLPMDLPSSLEHKLGHIRYTIKATFERPWKFDYEIKTSFTIVSNYDLNQKPMAVLPLEDEIEKSFCYFCLCPWGKLRAVISVPSSGFVAGQVIPVTVHCENESTVSVSKIKVYLKKKLKFYAMRPTRGTKEEEIIVVKAKCERPFTASFEDHVTVQLKVPPLPSSGLEFCSIMDLDYSLKVVICFSGMHLGVERNFPILIGTVPLYRSPNEHIPNSVVAPPPTAPLLQQAPSSMPFNSMPQPAPVPSVAPMNPPYPGQWDATTSPPPPYDAAMCGTQNIGGIAPPYPVYDKGSANAAANFSTYDKR